MLSVQMPLKIGLKDEASFSTFVTETPELALSLNQLQNSLKQSLSNCFYLQGQSGSGKSHILQAACRFMASLNQAAVYLPLKDSNLPLIAESLNGLEQAALVCIDDMDERISEIEWQKALASLLIKAQSIGHVVVFSGQNSFVEWENSSKELNSALMGVLTIELMPLTQSKELVEALQRHAQTLGFELPVEVGNYLIKMFSNDLAELMAVLKLLEQATLAEKRRLTLPFVKTYLNGRITQ